MYSSIGKTPRAVGVVGVHAQQHCGASGGGDAPFGGRGTKNVSSRRKDRPSYVHYCNLANQVTLAMQNN